MSPPGTLKQRLRAWDAARRQRRRAASTGALSEGLDYPQWVALYDTVTEDTRRKMRARAERMVERPRISVLMPVYNPSPAWLRAALESVLGQIYESWELCIADDCSTDPAIAEVLADFAARDVRIKTVRRQENGHISAASNTAFELATGEFVALLDHDDLLPEHALLCVAEAIARLPDVAVIYSDEDKIDASGQRCEPHFKPDWNPELSRRYNMICHLGVYRADLVREVGGFRIGYEGAQDYDLALRCADAVAAQRIVHIPHVLYHWRIHGESTSGGNAAKPYALAAGRRAIEEHLVRQGLEADVEINSGGWYEVEYRAPCPLPAVTVVIADTSDARALLRCLRSTAIQIAYSGCDIVIATRRRRHGLRQQVASEFGTVRWHFAARMSSPVTMCNQAAENAAGKVLVFLDSACEFSDEQCIDRLVSYAIRPGTGAAGAKLSCDHARIAGSGVLLGIKGCYGVLYKGLSTDEAGYAGRAVLPQNLSAIGSGCITIERSAFERVGGFTANYRGMMAAAIDLSLKLGQPGLRNVWVPSVRVRVHGGQNWRPTDAYRRWRSAKDDALLASTWPSMMQRDPAYNVNLTLARETFAFADPPRVEIGKTWFD